MVAEHQSFLDLIPWYVNGTLPEDERQSLERHLQTCLPCHAVLKQEQRVRQLMHGPEEAPQLVSSERGVERLLDHIERKEAVRRMPWSFGPVLRYGAAAAFGGAIVWLVMALWAGPASDGSEAAFDTLSEPSAASGLRIDVVFEEAVSGAERERFIAQIGELVSGPSQIGRYTIMLPDSREQDLNEFLQELADDPRVAFAGRSFIDDTAPEPDSQ